MKKYKVYAVLYEYGYFEVEAEDEDRAREKVLDGDEHFVSRDSGCDLEEVEEIK